MQIRAAAYRVHHFQVVGLVRHLELLERVVFGGDFRSELLDLEAAGDLRVELFIDVLHGHVVPFDSPMQTLHTDHLIRIAFLSGLVMVTNTACCRTEGRRSEYRHIAAGRSIHEHSKHTTSAAFPISIYHLHSVYN